MSETVTETNGRDGSSLPGPFQHLWILVVTIFDLLLLGGAVFLSFSGYYTSAGISVVIAGFIALYTAVVYAGIWWMKQV